MSWSDWHRTTSDGLGSHSRPLPAEAVVSGDTWLLARQGLTAEEAANWLEAGTGSISPSRGEPMKVMLPAIGKIPRLSAELSAPAAVVRVLPHVDSAISALIAGLGLPAQAMMWAGTSEARLEVPEIVDVDGQWCAGATRNLTGFHITPPHIALELATATGLLVGRAERRAWLRDLKGDGKFGHFNVELSWDPDLIGLYDLELTYEQFVGGDIASSAVIRLEDLNTESVDDKGHCQVSLVSLGSGIRHGVTLRTVDGDLLDRSGPYPLAERVQVGLEINGQAQAPIVVGEDRPPVSFDDRSERARTIESEIKQVLRAAPRRGSSRTKRPPSQGSPATWKELAASSASSIATSASTSRMASARLGARPDPCADRKARDGFLRRGGSADFRAERRGPLSTQGSDPRTHLLLARRRDRARRVAVDLRRIAAAYHSPEGG